MASEQAAPSTTASPTGDGKGKASGNVSMAQAVQNFVKKEQQAQAPKVADTKPTEGAAPAEPTTPSNDSQAATEQAQPGLPETKAVESQAPTKPDAQDKDAKATDVPSQEPHLEEEDATQGLDDKTKAKIQRKFDKLTAKSKATEAQVEMLQKQLTTALQAQQAAAQQSQVAKPDNNAPIPEIKDQEALKTYKDQAKQTVRWAEEVLDNLTDSGQQEIAIDGKSYTKADIKAIRRNAQVALEDKIPAQTEYFQQQATKAQQRTQAFQAALERWPFLAEQGNAAVANNHAYFQQNIPQLLDLPVYPMILGALTKGFLATEAEESAKKATKATEEKKAEAKKEAAASLPKPKPPSDQTAVSTTGGGQRMSPDALAAKGAFARPQGAQSSKQVEDRLAAQERARMAAARG